MSAKGSIPFLSSRFEGGNDAVKSWIRVVLVFQLVMPLCFAGDVSETVEKYPKPTEEQCDLACCALKDCGVGKALPSDCKVLIEYAKFTKLSTVQDSSVVAGVANVLRMPLPGSAPRGSLFDIKEAFIVRLTAEDMAVYAAALMDFANDSKKAVSLEQLNANEEICRAIHKLLLKNSLTTELVYEDWLVGRVLGVRRRQLEKAAKL